MHDAKVPLGATLAHRPGMHVPDVAAFSAHIAHGEEARVLERGLLCST
jgi:hypothetical protein